jgi:nucleoside-diphosphate kinase
VADRSGPPFAAPARTQEFVVADSLERTLVLVKPDAVGRGLVGEVLDRLERKGLRLIALELRTLDRDIAEEHYAEHRGKAFFDSLIGFITSGPLVAAVVEGPRAIEAWRAMMGPTDPVKAPSGTIRGDFGLIVTHNLVHGSDSPAAAAREVALFFPSLPV